MLPKIVRQLEIPPKYQQAGISLLSYFSKILNDKYRNQEVKVKIEQSGLKITMIIETINGGILETVKMILKKYVAVLKNEMTPLEFYKDEVDQKELKIIELENKLINTKLEIDSIKKILQHHNKYKTLTNENISSIMQNIEEINK